MDKIDRKVFFSTYRSTWGALTQRQVIGLDTLITCLEADAQAQDMRHVAYMLATVKHECADTWAPIRERGDEAYFAKYAPGTRLGRQLGNSEPGDAIRYLGRGYVQITGRANYLRLSQVLGMDYALVASPDHALHPITAYRIMSVGMRKGLFTGVGLGHYINNERCDYAGARRIINGQDRASVIAQYASALEGMLRAGRGGGRA